VPPKLFKAADVCKMADVQPYVLRSWEKEFPGIGVDSTTEGGRLYRQGDVEQVRRIRALVFGEGLTVAGARRRLETAGAPPQVSDEEAAEVFEALGADARLRVSRVRDGLQSILALLSATPGQDGCALQAASPAPRAGKAAPRKVASGKAASAKRPAATAKGRGGPKRKRASA